MAWDQLLEQSGPRCLLSDLPGKWRVNVILGCCGTDAARETSTKHDIISSSVAWL